MGLSNVWRAVGCPPHPGWHEVVGKDRDSRAPHAANRVGHVVQLCLASRHAEHDLVVETCLNVLEEHHAQSGILSHLRRCRDVLVLPPLVTRQVRRFHLEVVAAALLDEPQSLRGGLLKLSQAHSHR